MIGPLMRDQEPYLPGPPSPELDAWLRRQSLAVNHVEPLAGDVSPRRYARLRLCDGASAILAAYPPSQEPVFHRFLRSSELLATAGVRVPAILAADRASLQMVLEDLGASTLYELPKRPWETWLDDYRRAAAVATRIAGIPEQPVAALNPVLDGPALRRELEQTRNAFWRPRELLRAELEKRLEAFLDRLCTVIDGDPRRPCHRDFMVRNLIPAGARLAVIDHQDLRLGPAAYDLASLLNDSLFPPPEIEEQILRLAFPDPTRQLEYRRCAVQRTLKAVGTFAAFAERGSSRHLSLIPPTLARCLDQMQHLEPAQELLPELRAAFAKPALC